LGSLHWIRFAQAQRGFLGAASGRALSWLLAESELRLDAETPSYLILSTEQGPIALDRISIVDKQGLAVSAAQLFADHSSSVGLFARDALLLLATPTELATELCERFQVTHSDGTVAFDEHAQLLNVVDASEGSVHALCVMPPTVDESAPAEPGDQLAANTQEQAPLYGVGTYTVELKRIECNDPRSWENWPYTGDKARLRGFYDNLGGNTLWARDKVKSNNGFTVDRYIHFSTSARVELWESDGFLNSNDRLGTETIQGSEKCSYNKVSKFAGSGGGHSWNYDFRYSVYGPGCTCQSMKPAIYSYSNHVTSTIVSSTITSNSYYCSGTTQYRQAWGDVTRDEKTYQRKYNDSCELHTYVSQTLASECLKYSYNVKIGGAVAVGSCGGGGGGGGGGVPVPSDDCFESNNQIICP
jgi:hypothetical protein